MINFDALSYVHLFVEIPAKQEETPEKDHTDSMKSAGGSIHYIVYIVIAFAVLIFSIVVTKVYQYKFKNREFSVEEQSSSAEYTRKKSRDYGSVSFRTLIYGQIDRFVSTKDVKTQATY